MNPSFLKTRDLFFSKKCCEKNDLFSIIKLQSGRKWEKVVNVFRNLRTQS